MDTESDECNIPKDFLARPGTVDFGRDYEIRMSALLCLRCIRNKELQDMWIATNVNECGAFDDLVLHVETRKKKKITYLIQLKHKMEPDDIGAGEFKKKNGNFSMEKYYETVAQIKCAIDSHSVTDTEVIEHLRENEDNLVFVLYTNRGTTKNNFLNKIDRGSNTDSSWMLYKMIDTSGNVSTFDYGQLGLKYKSDHKHLMEKFFLFTKQIHVSKLDGIIEEEVNGFIKNIVLSKLSARELVQQYLQFVTDWYKGKLGGFYPLTKTHIYKVLLANIVTPYMELSEISNKENGYCFDLWKKITEDKWITVVEADPFVVDFLHIFIYKAIRDYCENGENKNLWKRHPESLCKDMLRTTNRSKEVKFLEAYELLWKTGKILLVLNANDSHEFNSLIKLLQLFPSLFLIVVLAKVPVKLQRDSNLFSSLRDVHKQHIQELLSYPIKLQGRKSVKLLQFLTDNDLHYVSTKDVIYILNNKLSVGTEHSPLSDLFIKRTLETVWLNPEVLENKNETFIIKCDSRCNWKIYFTRYKLKVNHSQVSKFDHNTEPTVPGIIEINNDEDIKNLEKKLSLKNNHFHGLALRNGNYLQWIKSSGSIKNIKNSRKLSDITNYQHNTLLTNNLNATTIISACPGMGKSLLLNYLACTISTEFWVMKISLYNYADYYKLDGFTNISAEQHLEHFFNDSLPVGESNDLVKFIFNQYLKNKKVILLLDGFDEVPTAHHDRVVDMIRTITISKFFVIITTRPNFKFYLEEALETFAVDINPFTKTNQTDFLNQFFFNIHGLKFSEPIKLFVDKLLVSAKQHLNDQDQQFTGIPLQTQLLAEVFAEDCKYFIEANEFRPVYFDLLHLYERFINEKIKIVCKRFGNSSEDTIHNYKELRSLYALQLLFTPDDLEELKLQERLKLAIEVFPNALHQIQKDGIVVAENKTKITFVHRTFAEYLTADWLVNNINGENKNITRKLILKTFDPSLITVRNVFDRMLAKDCPLHLAIINRQVETTKSLFSNLKIVSKTDKYRRNFLHLLACWGAYHPLNIKTTDELKKLYQMVTDDPMMQIMQYIPYEKLEVTKDDLLGYTEVDYAIQSNSLNLAEAICAKLENLNECVTCSLNEANLNYSYYLKRFSYGSLGSVLVRYSVNKELLDVINNREAKNSEENELHYHIIQGNVQQASLLLCLEQDIDKRDHYGFTALHIASIFGDALIIQLLLANSADINSRDNSGKTCLHWAVIKGKTNIITMVLDNDINVNIFDNNGMTALHYAIVADIDKRSHIVESLLRHNADINIQDNYGKTVFHYALHYNQISVLKVLIESAVSTSMNIDYPNKDCLLNVLSNKDSDGGTILHWAADKGVVDLATLFLSYGANTEIQDEDGRTALHWAAEKDHSNIVTLLLSYGANIDATDNNGRTPLYLAVDSGNKQTVQLLLESNASVHLTDSLGRTPLLHAIAKNNKCLVEMLLTSKEFLQQKDNENMNILQLAVVNCDADIVKRLLSQGADIEDRNISGRTALITASIIGKTSIMQLLLVRKANIETQDNQNMTALLWASWNGNLDAVEMLVSNGANIEAKEECGRTPLICATENGHLSTVEFLLSKGVNVEAADNQGMTALNYAAHNNSGDILNVLISKGGAKLDTENFEGTTPLLSAARNGCIDIIANLLYKGASSEIMDNRGINALHYAAFQGYLEIVDLLLANGTEVDSKSDRGRTALIYAADGGHLSVVTLLLSKGADIEAKDNENMTALTWAAYSGHVVVVNLLVGLKANLEVKNTENRTPLLCAAQNGYVGVVKLLVARGADTEAVDIDGVGAVQWAAYSGFIEILTFFLSKGVHVDIKDLEGRTMLMHAASNDHRDVINLLLGKGANVNKQDDIGLTAMHYAARNGHVETIKLLTSKGADREIKDQDARTPLMRATYFDQRPAAEFLFLLEDVGDVNMVDNNKLTILHFASLHGNIHLMELVLNKQPDLINLRDKLCKTALIHAATSGHASAVTLLLSKGAEIDIRDNEDNTALIWAARNGCVDLIDVLVTAKANLETRNNYGCTPLLYAAQYGHLATVSRLLDKGANLENVDLEGFTAVHFAALNNHTDVLKVILDKGINVNQQDVLGQTALHIAAEKGNADATNILLSRGADMEIKDVKNQTALFCALNYNQTCVVQLLIEKGANLEVIDDSNLSSLHLAAVHGNTCAIEKIVTLNSNLLNLKSNSGNTALIVAAMKSQTAAVELLISKGADINLANNRGRTALHFAALKKDKEIIKVLINNQANTEIKDNEGTTALEIIVWLFGNVEGQYLPEIAQQE